MELLFKEEYNKAEETLYKKGFYLCNMACEPFTDQFEISDGDGNIKIDHLSLAQVVQLSEMI